jgi:hypothetical protein
MWEKTCHNGGRVSILHFCQWLESTPIGVAVRQSIWLFPIVETIHTVGIVLMAGTIAVVDLRLLGFGLRREPVSAVLQQVLPWTWAGFAIMFISGSLLVSSEAVKLYSSLFFRIKLALLFVAAGNALIFHWTVYRQAAKWDQASGTPARAKLAGLLSLTCWIGVIAMGRAIGYETK